MSDNKVFFGLEQVHIAFLDDTGDTFTWDEPIAIPGAIRFAPSPEGGESKFYADNGLYYSEVTNDGYTAELEMALFPDNVLKDMLGWIIDDNGMLVEVADGRPKEFALMAQVEGDKRPRRFVYYKCKASRPAKESTTKGESVEVATDTLSMVISPVDIEIDETVKRIVKSTIEKTDENKTVFNNFFDDVLLPSVTGS